MTYMQFAFLVNHPFNNWLFVKNVNLPYQSKTNRVDEPALKPRYLLNTAWGVEVINKQNIQHICN